MIDYSNKFRLDNKIAFVIGGMGLIGQEVSNAFISAGSKTIILDVNDKAGSIYEQEMRKNGYDLTFRSFDCT